MSSMASSGKSRIVPKRRAVDVELAEARHRSPHADNAIVACALRADRISTPKDGRDAARRRGARTAANACVDAGSRSARPHKAVIRASAVGHEGTAPMFAHDQALVGKLAEALSHRAEAQPQTRSDLMLRRELLPCPKAAGMNGHQKRSPKVHVLEDIVGRPSGKSARNDVDGRRGTSVAVGECRLGG